MKQRVTTAIVGLAIFFIVVFLFPPVAITGVFAILCGLATYEILNSNPILKQKKILVVFSVMLGMAVPFLAKYASLLFLAGLAIVYLIAALASPLFDKIKINKMALLQGLIAVIVVPFFLTSVLKILTMTDHGKIYILFPFAVAWLTDVFAMQGGMRIGKHKLCPKISPNKTVEGAICGLFGGIFGIVMVGLIFKSYIDIGLFTLGIIGLVGSAVSQVGDLSMSLVKRINGVKDFGNIFPGHGGILDRFDSVMLAAPFIELVLIFMGRM